TSGNSATLLDWNAGVSDTVRTLVAHANVLYAGGAFAQSGGQTRERLAAFTVANGATPGTPATLLNWNPGASSTVRTLAVYNNVLYAGGGFTRAGGQTRERLAAFTVANGATSGNSATLMDWNPGVSGSVYTLAVHNNVLYAGGSFTQVGGWFTPVGGQTRNRLAAFTVATPGDAATLMDWNPGGGTIVNSLIVDNGQILGGREESNDGLFNNPLFTIT